MVGEDQTVGNDNVLPPGGGEDNDLCDVVGSQGLAAFVDGVGLGLVAVEAHDGEVGLDLARVDGDDADARGDELLAQRLGEGADGGLGGAVDAAADVWLAACERCSGQYRTGSYENAQEEHTSDGTNVDNVARTAVRPLLEDGEDGLGHVDETRDVGLEHDVHVLLGDVRRPGPALDQAGVVDEDMNVAPLLGQTTDEAAHLVGAGDVELDGQDLDAGADLLADLGGELLDELDAARGEDETQVVGRGGAREL